MGNEENRAVARPLPADPRRYDLGGHARLHRRVGLPDVQQAADAGRAGPLGSDPEVPQGAPGSPEPRRSVELQVLPARTRGRGPRRQGRNPSLQGFVWEPHRDAAGQGDRHRSAAGRSHRGNASGGGKRHELG